MISQFIIAQLVKAQASFDEDDGVKIDDFLLDSIIQIVKDSISNITHSYRKKINTRARNKGEVKR